MRGTERCGPRWARTSPLVAPHVLAAGDRFTRQQTGTSTTMTRTGPGISARRTRAATWPQHSADAGVAKRWSAAPMADYLHRCRDRGRGRYRSSIPPANIMATESLCAATAFEHSNSLCCTGLRCFFEARPIPRTRSDLFYPWSIHMLSGPFRPPSGAAGRRTAGAAGGWMV